MRPLLLPALGAAAASLSLAFASSSSSSSSSSPVWSTWPLENVVGFASASRAPPLPPCTVTSFGAKGDNSTEDTAAIQQAIDSCGTVIFPPPGTYLTRPLNLTGRSDIALIIEPGATLIAWPDPDTYNATTRSVLPLLYHNNQPWAQGVNITLTGGGTIDGQGWRWWHFLKTRPRPNLIGFEWVNGLLLSNLTLRDSPSWNTILRGFNILVTDMTILSNEESCDGWFHAPNTDGINIGGQNITVRDCFVHNGDDCVPTNTLDNDYDTFAVLVERVTCNCGTNGGVPIMAGNNSIYNVTYRDMLVNGTNQGAGVKISEAYDFPHGVIANVTWDNITITYPRYTALYTNVFEEDGENCASQPTPNNGVGWLHTENLVFRNIRGTLLPGTPAGCFLCDKTSPCTGTTFENVSFARASAYVCKNEAGLVIEGANTPPPCAPTAEAGQGGGARVGRG